MLTRLALGLAALAVSTTAIPTIEAKGSKFFTSDGNQFFIKGIAYQLTDDEDPLGNADQCARDVALMKTLGTNSVRVYHVNPAADHDACMKTLADAGIYAWIDLDTTTTYVYDVASQTASWNEGQLQAFQQVMDAFQKYDNVAGFFVANELLNSGAMSDGAPYIKAAGADLKAYRDSQGYRKIPIGYSAADIPDLRPNLQNYMACGEHPLDFYSLNAYEWCGSNTYEGSGYDQLQKNASSYSIPIFFSETGCSKIRPRLFQDQSAIFGPEMSGTWSGAIIYEWIQEDNDYGLISYGPKASIGNDPANNIYNSYTRSGTPTATQPEFSNLMNAWKTATPSAVSMANYSPSNSPPSCPSFTSGLWEVSGDAALPTIGGAAVTSKPPTPTGVPTPSLNSDNPNAAASSRASSTASQTTSTSATGTASAHSSSGAATSLRIHHATSFESKIMSGLMVVGAAVFGINFVL
ncbi:Hypothetical protein R9X50_00279500 [Acrodontium crateriforme]|uniref:1,3-beta-glucanosyltransferase n=1 Tax=Acrodontium crateriforme TaxID=150365 RepID=A0AAQ3M7S5_9PEZI|nr:Hypothetical protein R9X50_00279500 [Acrodontium crateriforme]